MHISIGPNISCIPRSFSVSSVIQEILFLQCEAASRSNVTFEVGDCTFRFALISARLLPFSIVTLFQVGQHLEP